MRSSGASGGVQVVFGVAQTAEATTVTGRSQGQSRGVTLLAEAELEEDALRQMAGRRGDQPGVKSRHEGHRL